MHPKNPTDNTGPLRALSRRTGAPAVDLTALTLPLAVLENVAEEVARRLQVLPLRVDHGHLFIAIANPNDGAAIDEVAFLSGRKVIAYAAPPEMLADAIDEAYQAKKRGEVEWRGARAVGDRIDLAAMAGQGASRVTHAATETIDDPIGPMVRQALMGTAPSVREPFSTDAQYTGLPLGSTVSSTPRSKPRVLVVDDEPVIRQIVRQALLQRGYDVIEAPSGMDALRLIKEREPDAVLLDAMLPDVHGFDVCKRLKESRRYNHIPVVMMTAVYKGWRMAADLKESYGIASYLEKPFDIHEVVRHLENAIAGRPSDGKPDAAALSAEAQRLYAEGSKGYQRGDLEAAVAALASAVAIDPLSATLRHQLGLLYAHRGQDFAAIQELEMAVELDPQRFSALRNLAILFQRHGFRRKACEIWERALAHAPDEGTRKEIKDILVQLL
jgi:DNA-binding response OmpR family regulator